MTGKHSGGVGFRFDMEPVEPEDPVDEIAEALAAGKCGNCHACCAGYHSQCERTGEAL